MTTPNELRGVEKGRGTSLYPWFLLALVWLLNLLATWNRSLIPPLASRLMEDFGMSHAGYGVIFQAATVVTIFLSIPGGILADRLGAKRAVGIAVVLMACFAVLRGFTSVYWQLFVVLMCFGAVNTVIMPALPKMVRRWFPPRHIGVATGIYYSAVAGGMTVALATTYPLFGFDWRTAFWVMGVVILLPAVLWWLFARDSGGAKVKASFARDLPVVVRNLEAWKLALVQFFAMGAVMISIGFFPLALEKVHHMEPTVAHLVTSIFSIGGVSGNFLGALASDRLGLRKPFLWGSAILGGVFMFLLWFTAFNSFTWLFAFLAGSFPAVIMAVSSTVLTEHPKIGSNLLGTTAGFIAAFAGIGSFIWPVIAGGIVDETGGYDFAFMTAGILISAVAVFSFALKETGTRCSAYAE